MKIERDEIDTKHIRNLWHYAKTGELRTVRGPYEERLDIVHIIFGPDVNHASLEIPLAEIRACKLKREIEEVLDRYCAVAVLTGNTRT